VAEIFFQNWVEAIETLKPMFGATLDYRLQTAESVSRCAINKWCYNMYASYIQWNLGGHHFSI